MRIIALSFVALAGCNFGTGTLTLNMQVGDDTQNLLTADAAGEVHTLVLDTGTITLERVNAVDLQGDAEQLVLAGKTSFDFVNADNFNIGTAELPVGDYEQLHVAPANGDGNLALNISGTVTINNGAVVKPFILQFSLPGDEEQQFDFAFTLKRGDAIVENFFFDPTNLFNNIDFNQLAIVAGANNPIAIQANSGKVDVDIALDVLNANVITSFDIADN